MTAMPVRVLLVDPDPGDHEIIRRTLERRPGRFELTAAATRDDLEARLSEKALDVVLTDLPVPGLAVSDVVDLVAQRLPGTPVIIVTATGSEPAAIEAIGRGAADYVLKTDGHLTRLPLAIEHAIEMTEQRASLDRLRVMLERTERIANVGSWEWDSANDTVRWSTGLYHLFDLDPSRDPLPFDQHHRYYEPADFARLRSVSGQALVDGTPYRIELNAIRADGEVRRCLATGYPERESGGEIRTLYGTLQDITDLRETERALRVRERQYRALVENTLDVIWVATLQLEFTYVSPSIQHMFGYTPEEANGMHVRELCDETTYGHMLATLESELARGPGGDGVVIEVPLRRKDGSGFTAEVRAAVIYCEEGVPLYVQGSTRDISERHRLQAERGRLLQAIEQVAEGVVITGADGIIEYVNPEFERMTGYTADEAVGQNPNIISSGEHDEEFYRGLWTTILGGRTWRGRFINRRKDDTHYTEEATISPMHNESGEIVAFVAAKRDISRELEMEQQLRQAQKMEAIGRLAGGVAHDFNNMLGVILGYAQQGLDRVDTSDPLRRDLDEIVKAGNRSAELTRQLLGFARQQPVLPKIVDLNEVIGDLIAMFERMIREDFELRWQPGDSVWPVEIDPVQVDQILANLIVNARDAIEDGGHRITIATFSKELDEEYCSLHAGFIPGRYSCLQVSDDGAGMTPDILAHVFEPFFTTKAEAKGTGLGLATVYGIVKQNRGFINVYSEPGMGATFSIYLPARVDGEVESVAPRVSRETTKGSETVLLVEDETALLELSVCLLERLGYTVLPANRPSRAIEVAAGYDGRIDLLMTDVIMPEMNGRDLRDEIAAIYPGIRCLFVSGYPSDVVHDQGRLEEGVHFLQKPFAVDDLAEKLREALEAQG